MTSPPATLMLLGPGINAQSGEQKTNAKHFK